MTVARKTAFQNNFVVLISSCARWIRKNQKRIILDARC